MADLVLDESRVATALDASWELEALTKAALQAVNDLDVSVDESEDDGRRRLLLRGLLARTLQLNSALMSVLGDDRALTTDRINNEIFAGVSLH